MLHGANTWKDTEYSWLEMFQSCNVAPITYITLLGQGAINTAVLGMDVALIVLKKCNSAEARNALMGVTAAAVGINTLFMALCISCKLRYTCCNGDSPLKKRRIRQEKCCYDTTIVFSVVYTALTAAAFVSCYYLCK